MMTAPGASGPMLDSMWRRPEMMVCAKTVLSRFSGGLHMVSTKTLPGWRVMVRFLKVRCVAAREESRSPSVGVDGVDLSDAPILTLAFGATRIVHSMENWKRSGHYKLGPRALFELIERSLPQCWKKILGITVWEQMRG